MEIKPYKAKVKITGNGLCVKVPAWVKHVFDVHKGDELIVKLEKPVTDSGQHSEI